MTLTVRSNANYFNSFPFFWPALYLIFWFLFFLYGFIDANKSKTLSEIYEINFTGTKADSIIFINGFFILYSVSFHLFCS
jgi:hypothetical protein